MGERKNLFEGFHLPLVKALLHNFYLSPSHTSHTLLGCTCLRSQHLLSLTRSWGRRSDSTQWLLFSCTCGKFVWLLHWELVNAAESVTKRSGQRSQRQVMTRGSELSEKPNRYFYIISMELKCKVMSRAKTMVYWAWFWKLIVTCVIHDNDNHKMQGSVYH